MSDSTPVTIDYFVRAATDIELRKYLEQAGAVNQLFHVREPTPLDKQPTIRMNRDTLYSMAVVDISGGATLNVLEAGDRNVSVQVVNQDHDLNDMFLGGGAYHLNKDRFDTPYMALLFRYIVASDGSTTIHFGSCEDGRVNCLPIMEGWYYTVRLYQPAPKVIDGSWRFPEIEPLD